MPYTFKKGFVTENGASALNEATRLLEKVKLLLPGLSTENNPKYERFPAKITAVDGSGNYSWTEQFYDSSGAYSDLVNGRSGTPSNMPALERNGTTATAFPFYAVLQSRLLVDGQPVYEFDVSAGMHTIGITTEAVDGTPSYSGTKTIRFDEADGFSLSQPAAGVARIDMLSAGVSQAGIVDTASQSFAGVKTFAAGEILVGETLLTCEGTSGATVNLKICHNPDPGYGDTAGGIFYAQEIQAGDAVGPNTGVIRQVGSSGYIFADGFIQCGVGSYFSAGGSTGVTGTSGGGDTVTGGIITALGNLADVLDGLGGITGTYGG